MAKFPRPYFRSQRGTWCVQLDGKQITLGSDQAEAFREYHRLMAMRGLEQAAESAQAALEKRLQENPSLEVRRRVEELLERLKRPDPPERVRAARAVEALEQIGTDDARQVLNALAEGRPSAPLTQDAAAACRRLTTRPAP